MNLYIDKSFIDNFFLSFSKENKYDEIFISIFETYGNLRVFVNTEINSMELLLQIILENEFIGKLAISNNIVPIKSIEQHYLLNENSKSLIFLENEEEWLIDAREKGALCFTFDKYKEQLEHFINCTHFKYDLNDGLSGWEKLFKFEKSYFKNHCCPIKVNKKEAK